MERVVAVHSGCLECSLTPNKKYPMILGPNRRSLTCSRVVLAEKLGRPIRNGFMALHTCDNMRCVNPDHIYEGTRQDNVNDLWSRHEHEMREIKRRTMRRGSEHHNAKLTEPQVKTIKLALENGTSRRELAEKFSVATQTIDRIANNQLWVHVKVGGALSSE